MQLDQLHPKIQAVEPQTGMLTRQFFRWLIQLYERVGGPDDAIASLEQGELAEIGVTDTASVQLKKQVEDLQLEFDMSPIWQTIDLDKYQLFTTNTAYTTIGKQIIIVTSNITITLNSNPKDKETVIIKRSTTAGIVTIDANGRNVDGLTTYELFENYEAVQCIYSYPNDEWYLI